MVNASTGAAFTSSVTVAVTGDAGTQATGSVGSGACTHEGNGYHTYAPAQAETNYDLIAFTFTGSGAIPATVQVFTSFPQTGDSFARVGAPAGASISADVAAVKVDTAAVKVQTDKFAFTVSNVVDANMLRTNGDATSAANVAKTTRAIVRCTVGSASTTTSIVTSACAPAGAVADQFKGRIVTFDADTTTTALRGQSTNITASSNAAAPVFTVTALTTAPASGDLFSIT